MIDYKIFFKILCNKYDVVFFSESSFYTKYYIALLRRLEKENLNIIYLTSDRKEKINSDKIPSFYIGSDFFRSLIFQLINTKLFILTTTDLDNHSLKRSKNVWKYVYIFHSAVSVHKVYTQSAFDNYDAIFCNGTYQIKELKFLEEKNKSKKKEMVKTGYLYFEYLKSLKKNNVSTNRILIAPSWNYNNDNFFNLYLENLINKILDTTRYEIILRPHPEHFKRNMKIIKNIKIKFNKFKKFNFDTNYDNFESCNNSDILISDESGIILEYLLVFKKPVLCFDKYKKIHNPYYELSGIVTIEDIVKKHFANCIKDPIFDKIENYISETFDQHKDKEKKIDKFCEDFFFTEPSKKAKEFILYNLKNYNN